MTRYTVVKDMEISPALLRLPVDPVLVQRAGFPANTPAETLLLAQVVAQAGRYGGQWKVSAWVPTSEDTSQGEIVGEMWCQDGTERDDVLQVTDEWIRASEHVTFVPGSFYEVQYPADQAPYFVTGIILVRGDQV